MFIAIPFEGRVRTLIRSSFVVAKRLSETTYNLSGDAFQMTQVTAEQVLEQLLLCGTGILELQKKSTSASPEENLREVIDKYLREHYREDISLEQLADFLHFNPSYTSDLFKRIFGKPFVSYLTSMRVETAKVLLERGKFKTYEIAEHVGYQDEKYFFKTFKKVTGFTPKEYRKRHLK